MDFVWSPLLTADRAVEEVFEGFSRITILSAKTRFVGRYTNVLKNQDKNVIFIARGKSSF
jgi:hypothetical protein